MRSFFLGLLCGAVAAAALFEVAYRTTKKINVVSLGVSDKKSKDKGGTRT